MMKRHFVYTIILYLATYLGQVYAQEQHEESRFEPVTKLFLDQEILELKLSYSLKNIRRKTNDSTYLKIDISYENKNEEWISFKADIRKRGQYRLNNCYFPPVKLKINKSDSKGTFFEGNKKIKLVLPCYTVKRNYDYIIKEYMAYKLFELISPYHYKTRLVQINFTETKNKKLKNHEFIAFMMEDVKRIAKRYDGKVVKRWMHPLAQDDVSSVRNAFFQFMIANTDFSTAALHNEKLLYINKKVHPVPFDFDLSGLVDASYAFVAMINEKEQLPITSVTDRLYRGFRRDAAVLEQVRNEFLDKEVELMKTVESLEALFEDEDDYLIAKSFILDFFEILKSDKKYRKQIINQLRDK